MSQRFWFLGFLGFKKSSDGTFSRWIKALFLVAPRGTELTCAGGTLPWSWIRCEFGFFWIYRFTFLRYIIGIYWNHWSLRFMNKNWLCKTDLVDNQQSNTIHQNLGGFLPGSLGGGEGPGGWAGAERFACMTQDPKISSCQKCIRFSPATFAGKCAIDWSLWTTWNSSTTRSMEFVSASASFFWRFGESHWDVR